MLTKENTNVFAMHAAQVSSGQCSEELLKVFGRDLDVDQEGCDLGVDQDGGDHGVDQEQDWEKNWLRDEKTKQERLRRTREADSQRKDKKMESLKSTEGDSRRPRVRVQSAPQSRKFAPTVPEPFAMTLREEERRRSHQLAAEVVKPTAASNNTVDQPEHFKAIPMPDHVKDESRSLGIISFC